jgi:hypothetical protein
MMLSSPSRAFTTLALALAPSIALAQQPAPVVPATGEPPPPETRVQEQGVIASQAQQAYVAAHQEELRREAARQVEQERRAAWEQRGRDNIPPPVIVRPPAFSLSLPGRFGAGLRDESGLQLGLSAELDLRVRRWWGLGASAGLLSARSTADVYTPSSRMGAVITEASGYLAIPGRSKRYVDATHGVLRVGHQLLFPVEQPALPKVYLGLFAGLGGVFPVGPIAGGKGWVGINLEMRIGYRFGLGSGDPSPIEGSFLDVMAGPLVGF